jgi:hypothetical protein
LAGDVARHLTSVLVDPEHLRGTRDSNFSQVDEKSVYGRYPGPSRPPDRVSNAHHLRGVASSENVLAYPFIVEGESNANPTIECRFRRSAPSVKATCIHS